MGSGFGNLALNVAGVGMSVYQDQYNAKLRRAEAELEASGLEAEAARKELEAGEALKMGELAAVEEKIRSRADIAGQTAEYAHSGVRVDAGTPVEVAADKAAWSEYERQKIEYGANLESWGLNYDAALLRQGAANARASGSASAGSWAGSLVGAGTKLSNMTKQK